MINYYIYDCESTGLKAGWHEINQISIIRVSDGFQKTINIAVKNPGRASQEALDIQRITRADLKRGISIDQAVKEVNEFINEDGMGPEARCIVGHNISFDRRFAHAAWMEQKQRFPADLWLCTKKFYKEYVKKVGQEKIMALQKHAKVKYGLVDCMVGAGLPVKSGAHSATIDSQNNLVLYKFYLEQKLNHVKVIENQPHQVFMTSNSDVEIYNDFE